MLKANVKRVCAKVKAGGVGHDASKVKVYGDGVKPTGVLASLPVSFAVDTSQAGVADVDILIQVILHVIRVVSAVKTSGRRILLKGRIACHVGYYCIV